MTSITALARQATRVLTTQAVRLREKLERLAAQVREAVARTVSQAVAEAAHEALQIVLEGPPAETASWHSTPEEFGRPWDADEVNDSRRKSSRKPRTLYESLTEDDEPEHPMDPEDGEVSDDAPASTRPRRWSRALTVGCQAAAWWLRRHPGRLSGLTAAGIGVAAGLVAFLASPLLASAGTVAATALGVLALADAARSAAGVATGWL
jgi:hypothetical protein